MRLLADENIKGAILRGLLLLYPDLDIIRVQDTEIYQAEDPLILAWAAKEGRILISHDIKTMPKFVYERINAGLSVPGIIEIPQSMAIGRAIDDLSLIIGASDPAEWENQVTYLPI